MELAVLQKDMVTAMKAKDKVRKEAISSLISAVKKVAIDEGHRDDKTGTGRSGNLKRTENCKRTDRHLPCRTYRSDRRVPDSLQYY